VAGIIASHFQSSRSSAYNSDRGFGSGADAREPPLQPVREDRVVKIITDSRTSTTSTPPMLSRHPTRPNLHIFLPIALTNDLQLVPVARLQSCLGTEESFRMLNAFEPKGNESKERVIVGGKAR
jgi:hypothetical protein